MAPRAEQLRECHGGDWMTKNPWLPVADPPTTTTPHKLGNPPDFPALPGPGMERWSQAPLGDTHPLAHPR